MKSQPSERITCPSCSMSASPTDVRHLIPVTSDDPVRRCRNCGALLDLSSDAVRVLAS